MFLILLIYIEPCSLGTCVIRDQFETHVQNRDRTVSGLRPGRNRSLPLRIPLSKRLSDRVASDQNRRRRRGSATTNFACRPSLQYYRRCRFINRELTTMQRRLSWNQIKAIYRGEWVELTELDWEWDSPFPKRAVVRHHFADRADLMAAVRRDNRCATEQSTILFLGFTGRSDTDVSSAVVI